MARRLGLTGQPPTPDVLTIQNQCCRNQNIPECVSGGRYWVRTSDPLLVRQVL